MSLVPSKRPHTDDATTPVSPVPDITNSDQQPDPKTKCAPRKKKVHPPWHTCQGYGVTDRSRKARDVWGDYMEDYWFMAYDRRPYEQGLERVNLTTFAIAPYVPVYLVLEVSLAQVTPADIDSIPNSYTCPSSKRMTGDSPSTASVPISSAPPPQPRQRRSLHIQTQSTWRLRPFARITAWPCDIPTSY